MTYTIEQLKDWYGPASPPSPNKTARDIIPELIAELEARDISIAALTDCVNQTGSACAKAMNAKLDLEDAYKAAIAERDQAREELFTIRLQTARECLWIVRNSGQPITDIKEKFGL